MAIDTQYLDADSDKIKLARPAILAMANWINDQGVVGRVVDSVAALKALDKTKSTRAFVTGYYAAGDGGGGAYWYDSTDTASTDNGGTIIVAADGGRWKLSTQNVVSVAQFGAKGDGETVDTAAFEAARDALPSGGCLRLQEGKTYLLDKTFVLTKPIRIEGGAKENTTLLFASGGTYLAAPHKCGILAIHSTTLPPGYTGDARRSVLSGFTAQMQAGPASMRGFIIACPTYLREVDALNFSSDGFATMAGASSPVAGNANGSTFYNCTAQSNTGSGFYNLGDDTNACVFYGSRAFSNGEYGFYDDSLLGNTYIGCETDLNTTGGYFATNAKPNRSVYFGCYGEGNQPIVWNIGARCVRLGSLGALANDLTNTGLSLSAVPSGDGYFNKPLAFAETDAVANALTGGPHLRVGSAGLDYRAASASKKLLINGASSSNYTDVVSDTVAAIRFPNSAVIGNIAIGRPYFPSGLSVGDSGRSAIVGAGTAAPASGTYDRGAIWLNDLPAAGGFIGWVCVTAGTPGTWKTFGAISA